MYLFLSQHDAQIRKAEATRPAPTSIRWTAEWRNLPQSSTAYDLEGLGAVARHIDVIQTCTHKLIMNIIR